LPGATASLRREKWAKSAETRYNEVRRHILKSRGKDGGESAEAHYNKALGYFSKENPTIDDLTRAIEEVKESIALEPKRKEFWKLLGACYQNMNQMGEAVEAFREAVNLDPQDIKARKGLAATLHDYGDREGARNEYRFIIEHPSSTPQDIEWAQSELKQLSGE
jgi:Tfp pilus assembly protein PilF